MTHTPVRPAGVNIALMRRQHTHWQVLMVQRAPTERYPLAWGLVSGTRQGDESLVSTAVREVYEELSIETSSLWSTNHLITFYDPEDDRIWHAPVFVQVVENELLTPSSEIAQFAWLTCEEAVARSRWKSLRRILPELFEEITRFPDETWQRLDTRRQP